MAREVEAAENHAEDSDDNQHENDAGLHDAGKCALVAFGVSLGCGLVSSAEALLQGSLFLLLMRFEQDGAEGGGEGKGVQSGEADGDGHGQTELAVERTGRARHKAHGHEHCHHDERNRNDSAAQLAHRVDRGLARRGVALVEFRVHAFHHHNSIVHHNGNGKHHSRKRQQVDGETDDVEREERTDQCHRYGNGGDKRGAEVLQEDKHHDEHEDKCLNQGLDYFVDRGEEEVVHALCHLDVHAVGQIFFTLFEEGGYVVDNLRGVGAGNLHHDTRHSPVAVHLAGE